MASITISAGTPQTADRLEKRTLLHRLMVEHLNNTDLQTLYFDLGVDYDSITGENKDDKVRNLILKMIQEGRIKAVAEWCRGRYANVTWPDVT